MKIFKHIISLNFILFICSATNAQTNKTTDVKSIIEHYFKAIGGKEKALQITTFSSVSNGILDSKKIVLTKKLMLPNYFYSSMDLNGYMVSKNVFNGTKGYIIQQDIEEEFDSKELKRHKQNRSIFPEFDYLKNAEYIGIEKVNNKDAHVIKVENTKIYYSKETGLKVKGLSIKNKNGHVFEQQLFFSKYIKIEGIKFPSQLTILAGSKKIKLQTQTILINRDVRIEDFN